MAYEKNTWARGDVVTSAKLNHMEEGIAGMEPLIVGLDNPTDDTSTMNKTWQEIYDAIRSGRTVLLVIEIDATPDSEAFYETVRIIGAFHDNVSYGVLTYVALDNANSMGQIFNANSADGYPVFAIEAP